PIPGHFLNTAHTREHWRDEHNFPKVADEEAYPVWVAGEKKDMLDNARDRMDHILATHQPEPLTAEQDSAIQRMLTDARDHYRAEGLITDTEWATYMNALENAG
ncbi:trimethylamine methyltransferase family protein, partial [bacterium]|nr:trimethylamine methyltransferase family protein [bacterium]